MCDPISATVAVIGAASLASQTAASSKAAKAQQSIATEQSLAAASERDRAEQQAAEEKAAAQAQEEQRQARVNQNTADIKSAFSGFDDNYANTIRQNVIDYYQPQLDKQFKDARKQSIFSLADKGQLNSSVAGNMFKDIADIFNTQQQNIITKANDISRQRLDQAREQERALIDQATAAGGLEDVIGLAQDRVSAIDAPVELDPLSNAFVSITDALTNKQLAANAGLPGGIDMSGQLANLFNPVTKETVNIVRN